MEIDLFVLIEYWELYTICIVPFGTFCFMVMEYIFPVLSEKASTFGNLVIRLTIFARFWVAGGIFGNKLC